MKFLETGELPKRAERLSENIEKVAHKLTILRSFVEEKMI